MNPKKAKKMFIQNGCFAGLILVIMVGLIKLSNQKKKKNRSLSQIKQPAI
jgi:hypothetical protein